MSRHRPLYTYKGGGVVFSEIEQTAIKAALAQARRVHGRTSPNPPVGAVVVRDGVIVGQGATQPPGQAHAERVALAEAGEQARGADLYVTLEPCTFHGRTPPCTDAIIASGIKRVFFLCGDPDTRMGSGAAAVLAPHGIEVNRISQLQHQMIPLLGPFFTRIRCQRPWVTLKYAMSLDGKIATYTGTSQWISGAESRQAVHVLRDHVDAIMTGSGTVHHDNPQLTTRIEHPSRPIKHPLRVVIDGHGHSDPHARIFQEQQQTPTIVFSTQAASAAWRNALTAQGVEVIVGGNGAHVDLSQALRVLAERHINHLLVEAGAGLAGALADCDMVDEIQAFIAPSVIGNNTAPGPVGGNGHASLIDVQRFHIAQFSLSGTDVWLRAFHRQHVIDLFENPHIFAVSNPS
jgi:diaminohydroxyphosphoribosylaminopyrimidine deaminase/5-amino-6-(5-phosphoribosylamino)uracil reductase